MMWDHPRVCGEHWNADPSQFSDQGSSPRMRGARTECPIQREKPRIIPAYAGSTNLKNMIYSYCTDHPRVCGEHVDAQLIQSMSMGSSPRMRGAHHLGAQTGLFHGIIPAYAGSTLYQIIVALLAGDHPRVCGEHQGLPDRKRIPRGSSPRMRGARMYPPTACMPTRIIPAYAGSTWQHWRCTLLQRDHPRVCGEHTGRI